jgi:hypothetical protein
VNSQTPDTSRAGGAGAVTEWAELCPPFNLSSGATSQFFLFVAGSSLLVYFIGSLNREGGGLVLAYLLVFPGALGVGWFGLWLFWCAFVAHRRGKRVLSAAHDAFEEHARSYGAVHHLDDSLDGSTFTGLAVVGTSLLVVQDGRVRKFHRTELRGWRWEIRGSTQILSNGNGFETLDAVGKDIAARERVNGVYLQTFDPSRPEVHFKTSSEEVCRRWEMILENITSGRTVID